MWWDGAHRRQFILRLYHYVHLRKQTAWKQIEKEREREGKGEGYRNIDPPHLQLYIKWIKLIKVARTVCILSTSFKLEALKTCIQYLMNFQKMKGKEGSMPFRAGKPQQTKWSWGKVWIWLRATEALFVDQHQRASHSWQSAAANRQLIPPSTLLKAADAWQGNWLCCTKERWTKRQAFAGYGNFSSII